VHPKQWTSVQKENSGNPGGGDGAREQADVCCQLGTPRVSNGPLETNRLTRRYLIYPNLKRLLPTHLEAHVMRLLHTWGHISALSVAFAKILARTLPDWSLCALCVHALQCAPRTVSTMHLSCLRAPTEQRNLKRLPHTHGHYLLHGAGRSYRAGHATYMSLLARCCVL